ncbi:MAG: hypothetical protein HUJ29_03470 [Gammaproteobacteria bacterium]|nr:hypothetical protein [Gammaproteobacteria bacterium]
MIEKLVYIASQYPGENIVNEIVTRFEGDQGDIRRWNWTLQITNLLLLFHLLRRYLEDDGDMADLTRLIQQELMDVGINQTARVGDYIVDAEELRFLATRDLNAESEIDANALAVIIMEHRSPLLFHALEACLRNQALDSLPPDYGMMTYVVQEFLKQVNGYETSDGDNSLLVAALEGLFEDYYRHLDTQIQEYFTPQTA